MWDFNRIKLIAKREVTTRLKMKAFRVTLIVQVIIALLAGLVPVGMAFFGGESSNEVIVVDGPGIGMAERLDPLLEQDIPGMTAMTVATGSDVDEARQAVKDGDAAIAVIVTGTAEEPAYEVITSDGATSSLNAQLVQAAIVNASIEQQAIEAGMAEGDAHALMQPAPVSVEDPEGETHGIIETFSGPNFAIINIAIIITYMALMMFGMWVSQGVVEEKASRIMEIMVNAATPRDLLFGKVLGVLGAGLVQLAPMMLAGALSFALQPRIADALDLTLPATFDIDFAAVSIKVVAVILVYSSLGFILYAAFFAATASMVSRQEEVGQTTGPVIVLIVIGMMFAYAVIALPNSLMAKWLFIIPLTSPFAAMPRILGGDPSALEIALSVGVLAVSALGAMMLAAKVYRTGVLMYGQKAGLMTMFRRRGLQQVAR